MSRSTRDRTAVMTLRASPEQVWEVLADVGRWPRWCPGIRSARLGGPLRPGTAGHLELTHPIVGRVHERTAPAFRVVDVEAPHRLVIEQSQPAGALRIVWTLEPGSEPDTVRWTQRLTASGRLRSAIAPVVHALLGRDAALQAVRLFREAGGAPVPDGRRVVVAGGSGTLGRRLCADLVCRGHEVIVLTRRADRALPLRQVPWDGRTVGPWADELAGERLTSLVNLAGRLVDARPTEANIADLRESRVRATRALVAGAFRARRPVEHWVQASTTAIWGDAGEARLTEASPLPEPGLPQMTGVARPWEEAVRGARAEHLVVLRTSLVLDVDAPVLDRLLLLARAGLGGRVGTGRQWISWIHIEDWLAIVRAGLGLDPDVRLPDGVVVASAPHPERNRDLMKALRRRLHRPWAPPTPAPLVRAGSALLRTDPALGLTGRHATSRVLPEAGFTFRYPRLPEALADLLG